MLCPASSDPLQDPVFAVPALGPPYEDEEDKAADLKQPKPLSNLKPKLEADSQTEPVWHSVHVILALSVVCLSIYRFSWNAAEPCGLRRYDWKWHPVR